MKKELQQLKKQNEILLQVFGQLVEKVQQSSERVLEVLGGTECQTCNRWYPEDEMTAFNTGEPVCIHCLDNADEPEWEEEEV